MSEDNVSNDFSRNSSNSHLIKQKMATTSIYKNNHAGSSSSRLKLNIEISNGANSNKIDNRSAYSVNSANEDPSVHKKKRDSLILSTYFVPTRNRTSSFTPVERNPNNRVSSNCLASTTSPTSPAQSLHLNSSDSLIRASSNHQEGNKILSNIETKSNMFNTPNINFTKKIKQDDSNASLNSEILSPRTANSKKIFFKSRRNTAVNSKEEDSTDIEDSHHYDSLNRKDSIDSFIDVKEERERLAFKQSLTSSLNKLIRSLNKQYEQQDEFQRILNDTDKHIMQGSYTSEHINQYSKRLKANTHIQQTMVNIKKLEKEIDDIKQKLEDLNSNKRSITEPHSAEMTDKNNLLNHRRSESYLLSSGKQDDHSAMFLTPIQPATTMFKDINPLSPITDNSKFNAILNEKKDSISNSLKHDTANEADTWEISDCLQSLQEKTLDSDFILEKSNRLVELLKKSPKLKDELVAYAYIAAVQNMVLSDNSKIIAAGYRTCRYYFCSPGSFSNNNLKLWDKSKIELSLIKTLTKTPLKETVMELEQALKLIRGVMETSKTASLGIIQALISQLENSSIVEDSMGTETIIFVDHEIMNKTSIVDPSIELLLEMCYLAPKNIVQTKCNRLLEKIAIVHKNYEISKIIINTILNLLTMHETRGHYLNYFSFQFLFETFTSVIDNSPETSISKSLIEKCIKLLSVVMKSFTGLMVFASNGFNQVRELVQFVKIPFLLPYLVDLFLDVLNIYPINKHGNDMTFFGIKRREQELHVLSQYKALLCKAFIECHLNYNIKTALATISLKPEHIQKCQFLITEFNKLCSEYFNDSVFQNLVEYVEDPFEKQDRLSKESNSFVSTIIAYSQGVSMAYNMNKNEDSFAFLQFVRISSSAQIEMDLMKKIDDTSFKNLIDRTGVLFFKNYTQWDWSLLLVICRSMLKTNKRIEELNRNTKFIRRLIVFYRPYRFRFSGIYIKDFKNPDLIIDVGCAFFRALCETKSGLKIFNEDLKFFPQIINSFYKLFEGIQDENVFIAKSLKNTMSSGYVKLLCSLTSSSNGVSLLNKWNIFSIIYKLFQFRTEEYEYLLCLFLRELSLWNSPHSLLILQKAMVCESTTVKRLATDMIGYHLGILRKPDVPFAFNKLFKSELTSIDERMHVNKVSSLTIEKELDLLDILIRQLYDISPSVVAAADKILYSYSLNEYNNPISLTKHSFKRDISLIINLIEPMIDQLIMLNSPLLYLALTNKEGFEILNNKGYLESERQKWLMFKNEEYNNLMKQIFYESLNFVSFEDMPVHLYKTLASTESGIRYIISKGDFDGFLQTINNFVKNIESENVYNTQNVLKVESAVWCVGFIGSTDLGINLVESSELILDLIKISMTAKNVSLKFTCLFALGFISSTTTGSELIDSFNWTCSVDANGKPRGVCVPNDFDNFFVFPELLSNNGGFKSNEYQSVNSKETPIYFDNVYENEDNMQSSNEYQSTATKDVEILSNNGFKSKGVEFTSSSEELQEPVINFYGYNEKSNSSSLSLLSRQPNLMNHKNKSAGQLKNEFYPDSSSSDIASFTTDNESLSFNPNNEAAVDSTPIETKFGNEVGNISVPVEKFKIEVVSPEERSASSKKNNEFAANDLYNDLPNMTLNMDLDSLLFMRKIIEEPTLLNDENYETELELQKQENMIQSLNDFRFKNNPHLNNRKAFVTALSKTKNFNEQNELMMQKISLLVSQLNSHLLLNESRRELMSYYKDVRLREFFLNSDIVNKVIDFMAIYKYSFQVRKFLCDLFLSNKSIEMVMKRDSTKIKYYEM
ncbi:TORC2 complex subunit [Hanseniaspora uvarum]|nr:TORC2 complex subunit [Hanseniaspora uvarum]